MIENMPEVPLIAAPGQDDFEMPDAEKHPSVNETLEHIAYVRMGLALFAQQLMQRAKIHDLSKLKPPELEAFDTISGTLNGVPYGSPEYKQGIAKLGPALEHHYLNNPHHPHSSRGGIAGMSLVDLVEMWIDWYAACLRHQDGSLEQSIRINAERFQISPQLTQILENTRLEFNLK
jgi:hypothetical protein